jgi:hypothetical protein
VPPLNGNLTLRSYTASELAQIDIRLRGVSGSGDHFAEDVGPDGAGTPRKYSCAWEERYAAAYVFTGAVVSYTDSGGGTRISRALPDTFGHVAGYNWICTKAKLSPYRYTGVIEPVFEGQQAPKFERCDIEPVYELVPYSLLTDASIHGPQFEFRRYVIRPGFPTADVSSDTNAIVLPSGALNYTTVGASGDPAGIAIPYGFPRPETVTVRRYVWKRLPADGSVWGPGTPLYTMVKGDGTAANRGYLGAVNLTQFDSYPPLSLQLIGVEERIIPDPLGQGYALDLTYVMREKNTPYGHLGYLFYDTRNTAGSAESAQYFQVQTAGYKATFSALALSQNDSVPPFVVREFANLFNPNGPNG